MSHAFRDLGVYKQFGAHVGFECGCGVKKVVPVHSVLSAYPARTDPNRIARKMRCKSCKRKDVTAYPVMSDRALQPRLPFKATWFGGAYDPEKIGD